MYPIAIVAFIATSAFYRLAKARGLHPGKVAGASFFSAGILMVCSHLASRGIAAIASALNASSLTSSFIIVMLNLFLLLAYLMLIQRYWITFSRLAVKNRLGNVKQ